MAVPVCAISRAARDDRGLSLFEVVVALAVLAAIASYLAPTAFDALNAARGSGSEIELRSIREAIVGNQRTTFGYYGDVGEFPDSLLDLVRDPGSKPGWRGPYLHVPVASISGSSLLDPFGNPFEYYLLENVNNLQHRLALVSRGRDGRSTNTSATPATWISFAGTLPTVNGYLAGSGNADNVVFPPIDSANNDALLATSTVGVYAPTITNVDSNPAVNTAVSACPGLFTLTLASTSRTADVRIERLGPVFSFELQQGSWQATITSPLASGPVMAQTVTVLPGQALSPSFALSGINSAGTAPFTLSVFNNNVGVGLDVFVSNVKQATVAANNATTTYSVPGCAPVRVQRTNTSTVVDSFTMPYTNYLRNVNSAAVTLTVTNGVLAGSTAPTVNARAPEVRVFQYVTSTANLVQIGQVARGRQRTFTVSARDNIAITDNAGTVLRTIPTILANTSVTCTSSGCT